MEYLKKEDLIEGEIYKVQEDSFSMIGLITLVDNGNNDLYNKRGNATYITTENEFRKDSCWCYIARNRNIINATSEEKHWLNSCITADKFISYDEAMKTFIPEYLECVKLYENFIISQVYRLNSDLWSAGYYVGNVYDKYFIPLTKEAYDAQFVVKEPEPLPQFKVIETIETITKVENNEGNQFFIGDKVRSDSGVIYTIKEFKYNVDKTNILAITNISNRININKIEHYIEPKVKETLLEKAKRLYPVGTKFNSYKIVEGMNWDVEVLTTNIIEEFGMIKLINPKYTGNNNSGSWTLYKNNDWAKIIKK